MNLKKIALIILGISPLDATLPVDNSSESLNIVLSSTISSRSHIKYLFEIAKHLRNKGHNIIYAAPKENFKFSKPYNYTEYDIGGKVMNPRDVFKTLDVEQMIKNNMKPMIKLSVEISINQYKESFEKYEEMYKKIKADLIICDFLSSVCLDSARKSNVPVISGFQGLNSDIAGAPYITNTMDSSPTTTEYLSFYQRFKQTVITPLGMIYNFSDMLKQMNEVRKKYGVPSSHNPFGAIDQVMKISNTYIGFDDARPIPSTLKLVGPVMDDHIPELDQELQLFLDNRKSIYVAFGSNVVLSEKLLQRLMSAMQLAIDSGAVEGVLWSLGNTYHEDFPKTYEVNGQTYSTKSILDGTHSYIKALSWAPQTAILNHQNTKLFISHGGIESSHEAIHIGTPILLMPMLGDQPRNARLIKNRGVGDYVDTINSTPYDLFDKIKELTREDNYVLQDNIKHIQSISHYHNAMRENNAKFIENYAISAKICRKSYQPKPFEIPCELEPYMEAGSRMPFIAAYKIDIILTLFSIGLVVAFISLYIIYNLVKLLIQIPKQLKQKEE
ncbi:glycosyltransferase family 1 protein [Conidiobolus coronatus NRRL 28638]|uniref:Glycosyltransferase family 1 protein n=1 Tax=Conidiobolus coronatus (strain ATCC 28846 / CBS 209.66 / NRRL 28638) TaxID=796925 RepID=A0A137PFG9_CONC2|nr:glycosyltransferase family 1 protein [Conidiobolus coronatus NRRL 28638]|eukprot:KXN73744.1 glycosyltransferase family 1 protein [Conidiobolus coronatus NRRL 28638]